MRFSVTGRLLTGCCLCLLSIVTSPAVDAQAYQSHKSIYQAAQNYVREQVSSQLEQKPDIKAGKLDSRLKLNRCDKPLRAFLPKGSRTMGKTTVGVKCTGSKPWSLHVPVTISLYKNVLVAKKALNKGDILSGDDVKLVKRDVSKLSYGYFIARAEGTGMKVKRRVSAGTVLTPSMLKKPQVVSRGQKIAIMAKSGRMEVRMTGKALSNGAIGDRIKVMNMKSQKKLEGVITSPNEVKVEI